MSLARLGQHLFWGVVAAALLAATASATSKARIVRLSDVQGTVKMDRGGGQGFERAFMNLPVVEGSKLKTGSDGRAGVEFEDGTVLRITPESEVAFTTLSLGDDGEKLSTVDLIDGMAYVNARPKKGDKFTMNFGHESIALSEPAHFRVEFGITDATVAVLDGDVHVTGRAGDVEVAKKRSVTFDLGNNDKYAMNKKVEEEPYDKWDSQQSEYQTRYAANSDNAVNSPYAYGMSDLNYYGNFLTIPGYGMGWQPFFMNASWNPYMDGAWAWYPGYGYMWVSAYPWGWMPYMYGGWAFAPGYGWFWQPGYWNTFNLAPRIVGTPGRITVPVPPRSGRQLVMVGHGLTAFSGSGIPKHVNVAPGSAGLGVPRGSVKDLPQVAKEISQNPRSVRVTTESTARSAAAPPMRPMGEPFPGIHAGARGASGGTMRQPAPMHTPAPSHMPATSAGRPPH